MTTRRFAREWLWFLGCWAAGGVWWATQVSADLVPAIGGGFAFGATAYVVVGLLRLSLWAAKRAELEW